MTTTTRISQGERTSVLRLRLLEATVECLVEPWYAHTTTTMVSERAAVSPGAQLHHVPTNNDPRRCRG